MEHLYFRPEIAPDQFLPIFVVSTLVLVFGVGYRLHYKKNQEYILVSQTREVRSLFFMGKL